MSMTLTVPDEIAHSVQEIAADTAEHLLLQVLYAYFPPISPELQAEFDAWEEISNESMRRFEVAEVPI